MTDREFCQAVLVMAVNCLTRRAVVEEEARKVMDFARARIESMDAEVYVLIAHAEPPHAPTGMVCGVEQPHL